MPKQTAYAVLLIVFLLAGCGGGGDEDQDVDRQPVNCKDTPAACV